jgi:signal transduction histidine kinase
VDEATRQDYLSIIADEARRLEGLVGDLVDVKRIEQGRLELEPQPFDLGVLVGEQVRIYRGRSERHTIQLDPVSGPLLVRADRNRLAQVIANLLANAVKYSPDGGIVEVRAAVRNGNACVSVRDHGIGIPAADRSRIFTKFFRGGAGLGGIGGMGLGLAVSREIVEAHGGRMSFESEVGSGSIFWFEVSVDAE